MSQQKTQHKRLTKTSVFYDDLLRFQVSIIVYDKDDNDTL